LGVQFKSGSGTEIDMEKMIQNLRNGNKSNQQKDIEETNLREKLRETKYNLSREKSAFIVSFFEEMSKVREDLYVYEEMVRKEKPTVYNIVPPLFSRKT
jgi:thermostable 8-oxoguanine DNA glycosylase